jgi:O6-methylguanine-DNA--protein-cysteine methyltransferase
MGQNEGLILLSYGRFAAALGRPKPAEVLDRAVGTNPAAVVMPCHRVLGSEGR